MNAPLALLISLIYFQSVCGAFIFPRYTQRKHLCVAISDGACSRRPLRYASQLFVSTSSPSRQSSSSNGFSVPVLLQKVIKEVPLSSVIQFVKSYVPPATLPLPFSATLNKNTEATTTSRWTCDVCPNHILSVEIVVIQKKGENIISPSMSMIAVKRISEERQGMTVRSGNGVGAPDPMRSLVDASEKELLRDFEKGLEGLTMKHLGSSASTVDSAVIDDHHVTEKTSSQPVQAEVPQTSSGSGSIIDATLISDQPKESSIKVNSERKGMRTTSKMEGNDKEVGGRGKSKDPNEPRASSDYDFESLQNLLEKDMESLSEEEMKQLDEEFQSPEAFAKQLMDFANKKAEKEKDGAGFVEAAMETAKEVVKNHSGATTASYAFKDDSNKRQSAEEEELRRLFEAGKNIAEGKIALAEEQESSDTTGSSLSSTDSSGKPSMEKELAKLELRIMRNSWDEPVNTDEMLDLMAPPPSFDEEIIDATSVNYPGGNISEKKINLHPDLKQAIEYATFAGRILSNLEEEHTETDVKYFKDGVEMPLSDVKNLQKVVDEAVKIGIIDDPREVMAEKGRLNMLVEELIRFPEDRFSEIVDEYRDLLLSERFVQLIQERFLVMKEYDRKCADGIVTPSEELSQRHEKERFILGKMVKQAMLLLKEVQALGAELETMQLEVVRSICLVAMDPKHKNEEEAAIALTDAVRDMLPLLDETFVSYLKYAVAEEEGRLARRGVLEDPDHNRWLCVLKIVQNGVYAELGRKVGRHVEIIWYCMRMKTRYQRRELLRMNVDNMATMDIRPFRKIVDNIVGALGSAAKGDFEEGKELGEWTKRIMQLSEDIEIVLPPERIAVLSRDADKWLAKQKERFIEQRQKTKALIDSRKKGKEISDQYLMKGAGEEDRMA
mmetsp:Transcript_14575/g.22484  ORF Transcript_14575/g.22484 Transcript_14575/m.22484 type:complete len:895 (-) Transcript_14575:367-3051(-)